MNHSRVEAGAGGAGGSRVLSLGSSLAATCGFLSGHFPRGDRLGRQMLHGNVSSPSSSASFIPSGSRGGFAGLAKRGVGFKLFGVGGVLREERGIAPGPVRLRREDQGTQGM